MTPYILYSDGDGNIFEDTSLYVTGRSGWDALPIEESDWIELPEPRRRRDSIVCRPGVVDRRRHSRAAAVRLRIESRSAEPARCLESG